MMDENQIPVLGSTSGIEKLNLSPEEFFVLSRINGSLTIKQINQIVGFPIDKTIGFMKKFLDNNVITVKVAEEKPKKAPVASEKQTGVQILDQEDKDPNLSQIPRAFRSRIILLEKDLDKLNFFEVLEVSPSADSATIHSNYLRLVKEFHPDSIRVKDPGHYKRKLEKIFVKIQEAYQEIHPENKRAAYLHELMDGRRTKKEEKPKGKYEYKVPKKDVELTFANAETQYARGLKEEKKENLQAALNFFQMALSLNPGKKVYEESVKRIRTKLLQKHLKEDFKS